MYGGGITRLANGGQIMSIPDRMGQMHEVSWAGYPNQMAAVEAYYAGQNEPVNIRNMQSGEDQNYSMSFNPEGQMIDLPTVQSMGGASRGIKNVQLDPASQASLQTAINTAPTDPVGWDKIKPAVDYFSRAQDAVADIANNPDVSDYLGRVPGAVSDALTGGGKREWLNPKLAEFLQKSPAELMAGESASPTGTIDRTNDTGIAALIDAETATAGGGIGTLAGVGSIDRESPQTVFPGKQVQGTGTDPSAAAMLKAMYGMESDPVPDMADLMAEQRRDAYSNALMQLGAGIAGDDLSGGISRAGTVAFQGRQDARDLDLKARMAQYTADRGDIDRDIEILGKAGVIEASMLRSMADNDTEQGRMDRAIIARIFDLGRDYVKETLIGDPDAERKLMIFLKARMPAGVIDRNDLNFDVLGTGGSKNERPPIDSF
jgi:hypothetical protein